MNNSDVDVKERILNATQKLLLEGKDADRITVREIAKNANVNSALINYHFQSKDNLINQAVETCMTTIAENTLKDASNTDTGSASGGDPVRELKNMIKSNSTFGFKFYQLAKIAVSSALKSGNAGTVQMILPLLRRVYGDRISETDLKLIGLQLLIPMQVMYLYPAEYKKFMYIDLFNEQQRNELIDKMLDNILKGG